MTATDVERLGSIFADPAAYADPVAWHAAAARIRAESPILRVSIPEFPEFWAITKHADVMEIERQPRDLHQRADPGADAVSKRDRHDGRHPGEDADPDGRRRAQGAPQHRQRLVQARQRQDDAGPHRRAGAPGGRPDGGARRRVRLRERRRPALPAAGDPVDPRAARPTTTAACCSSPRSSSAPRTPTSSAWARTQSLLGVLMDFVNYFTQLAERPPRACRPRTWRR